MTALLLLCLTAATSSTPSGNATLPLSELVPLLTPSVQVEHATAVVTKFALKARPGESGLWVEGDVAVTAHGQGQAVTPLVHIGGEAVFEELSATGPGALSVDDRVLSLVAREGETVAHFKVLVRTGDAATKTAALKVSAQVPPTPLKLETDESLFELTGATVVREWGGLVVLPHDGQYTLSWRERAPSAKKNVVVRAPVEPRITEASSIWRSTLEGRATHTVQLALSVDRPTPLIIDVPADQQLIRARVNGEVLVLAKPTGAVTLSVGPAALGGTDGTVELLFTRDLGVFHLSGAIDLKAPRLSWPVQRWTTSATLPAVFTYLREGGSMELAQSSDSEPVSGDVPGRTMTFRQFLVQASAPNISLKYSVDISKSYFR